MLKPITIVIAVVLMPFAVSAETEQVDSRIAVELPDHVQAHFLKKMREHIEALNSIIVAMADGELELAADIASNQLAGHGGNHLHSEDHKNQKESGSGSTGKSHQHGEGHDKESGHGEGQRIQMGRYMPDAMKMMGQNMHQAANEFSITALEGDTQLSLKALSQLTTSCVVCHQAFRIGSRD